MVRRVPALAAIGLLAAATAVAYRPAGAEPKAPAAAAATAPDASWLLPAEGSCAPRGGPLHLDGATDAGPAPFETGESFELDRLEILTRYLPDFVWRHRERFFGEGMRLEIGPCFRDYAAPAFFRETTERFRGQPHLDAEGGLHAYVAGLPFAPETLDASQPAEAGIRWLWNVAHRYQGAGFHGRFRMTDLVGRIGRAEPFEGDMFKVLISHRADRADDGYAMKNARDQHWVAGGLFYKPFSAREFAWRQFRNDAHLAEAKRTDDLHAYLPQWRRVRRLSAADVEGLYMPSFAVGVQPSQQLPAVGLGDSTGGAGGVGGVGGTIEAKRSGYEGLEWRPNLYRARVVGLHDVLTPINATRPVYPESLDRDFGPWGLSFASDRWDLRRALVLDLRAKQASSAAEPSRSLLYLDLQTLHPLYMATFDKRDELTNVGLYVGRWSEDRSDYPGWPDDAERPVRVIDSVGAAFANLAEAGSWRRESWNNVSTPPSDQQIQRLISVGQLSRRR